MPESGYYLPRRNLVDPSKQAIVERPDVPRSKFTGSFSRKMTFNADDLVPFFVDEVLPGDHLKYDATMYVRMATPMFPLFDNQVLESFWFFVPARLLWFHWEQFMGQQANPTDSIAYTIPQCVSAAGGFPQNSLFDHFGLPVAGQVDAAKTATVNVLPIRAYALIWEEWFRDENLQPSIVGWSPNFDGPDNWNWYVTQKRGKTHDYFTSCLPWPQKFTPLPVPMAGRVPVSGIYYDPLSPASFVNPGIVMKDTTGANVGVPTPVYQIGAGVTAPSIYMQGVTAGTPAADYPNVFVDMANLTGGASLNALRQSWLIQELLERDARGGTRYVEKILAHFGVRSPDYRLQRPEYIGGGSSPVVVTPVAQTAPTAGQTLGVLGAAGTAVGRHRATYAATEHGYVLGLLNVRSELSYQQGLERLWSRVTQYDFYVPSLSGLGEQAVLCKEIYYDGLPDMNAVFGYQESWHELRTRYSTVTGMFRSTATGTLDNWHLAQRFLTIPALNSAFIPQQSPMSRVLAAGTLAANQQYLANILIARDAVRPLPVFGTPARIGRF